MSRAGDLVDAGREFPRLALGFIRTFQHPSAEFNLQGKKTLFLCKSHLQVKFEAFRAGALITEPQTLVGSQGKCCRQEENVVFIHSPDHPKP